MGDQPDPSRPWPSPRDAQAMRDHRLKSVGADDDPRLPLGARTARILCDDPANAPAMVPEQVHGADTLANRRPA